MPSHQCPHNPRLHNKFLLFFSRTTFTTIPRPHWHTDSKDVLVSAGGAVRTVTLEGEVVFRVLWVDVVDGNAALNAAQCKPGGGARLLVGEDPHAPVLQTQ